MPTSSRTEASSCESPEKDKELTDELKLTISPFPFSL